MDIFEKNNLVKGILEKLRNISKPIIENLRSKSEGESELPKGLMPELIRTKNK